MTLIDSDTASIIAFFLLVVLFAGDPDIADAIIYTLTNGKLITP
jgi:hypothetical protein